MKNQKPWESLQISGSFFRWNLFFLAKCRACDDAPSTRNIFSFRVIFITIIMTPKTQWCHLVDAAHNLNISKRLVRKIYDIQLFGCNSGFAVLHLCFHPCSRMLSVHRKASTYETSKRVARIVHSLIWDLFWQNEDLDLECHAEASPQALYIKQRKQAHPQFWYGRDQGGSLK